MAIPQTALIVAGPFGDALSAEAVARAIGRGLVAAGLPEPDLCPIEVEGRAPGSRTKTTTSVRAVTERDRGTLKVVTPDVAALLAGLDFDTRMRRARAVVLAEWRLAESALRASATFEIATRARQGGVPAYAVTGANALTPFDARILDLQMIVEAPTERALVAAGGKLAQVL
jgi:glycerate kinase